MAASSQKDDIKSHTDQWLFVQSLLDGTNAFCHLLISLKKRITLIIATNMLCLMHAGQTRTKQIKEAPGLKVVSSVTCKLQPKGTFHRGQKGRVAIIMSWIKLIFSVVCSLIPHTHTHTHKTSIIRGSHSSWMHHLANWNGKQSA